MLKMRIIFVTLVSFFIINNVYSGTFCLVEDPPDPWFPIAHLGGPFYFAMDSETNIDKCLNEKRWVCSQDTVTNKINYCSEYNSVCSSPVDLITADMNSKCSSDNVGNIQDPVNVGSIQESVILSPVILSSTNDFSASIISMSSSSDVFQMETSAETFVSLFDDEINSNTTLNITSTVARDVLESLQITDRPGFVAALSDMKNISEAVSVFRTGIEGISNNDDPALQFLYTVKTLSKLLPPGAEQYVSGLADMGVDILRRIDTLDEIYTNNTSSHFPFQNFKFEIAEKESCILGVFYCGGESVPQSSILKVSVKIFNDNGQLKNEIDLEYSQEGTTGYWGTESEETYSGFRKIAAIEIIMNDGQKIIRPLKVIGGSVIRTAIAPKISIDL